MLYVYLKSGEIQEIEAAVAARLARGHGDGDVLECLDAAGDVIARFLPKDVFFYSRVPQDAFDDLPSKRQSPETEDEGA